MNAPTPEFWLNLQSHHDLDAAEHGLRAEIERDVQPRAVATGEQDRTGAWVNDRRPAHVACRSGVAIARAHKSNRTRRRIRRHHAGGTARSGIDGARALDAPCGQAWRPPR